MTALLQDNNVLMNKTAGSQLISVPGQGLLGILCLPSWFGGYSQQVTAL